MKQYVKIFGKKYQVRENSVADIIINDVLPMTIGITLAGILVLAYYAIYAA